MASCLRTLGGEKPDNLSALQMPIQLLVGSKTTAAARAVVDVLRELWPSASYVEIEGASHMGPVTHPRRVNPIIARFLDSVDSA